MRTSPIHYIAPTAISIIPNCNDTSSDLAVDVSRGTKIKVYAPEAGIDMENNTWQEWTITGRNRSLHDMFLPYTIFARLSKTDRNDGYIVFAPKTLLGYTKVNERLFEGVYADKYSCVIRGGNGYSVLYADNGVEHQNIDPDYYYIRLGDVSETKVATRTLTFDTGILGTEQYNSEWLLNPDGLPMRIALTCIIDGEDAGQVPYLQWGKVATLSAELIRGWTDNNNSAVKLWTITRNTGHTEADKAWNYPDYSADDDTQGDDALSPTEARPMPSGAIFIAHQREGTDDVDGVPTATFTVTAWGTGGASGIIDVADLYDEPVDSPTTPAGQDASEEPLSVLASASITVLAESDILFGEMGDTPIQAFRWYADGITPKTPTETTDDVPSPASDDIIGDRTKAFPLDTWSATAPNRPGEGWALWLTQSVRHMTHDGTATRDAWSQPVRISGAKGDPGEDSKEREWIYIAKGDETTFSGNSHPKNITTPATGSQGQTKADDDFVPTGWSDNAIATNAATNRYVYASWREWDKTAKQWGAFHDPILWSNWGRQGIDGDGVQYIYKLFDHELKSAELTSLKPTNATQNAAGEWLPTSSDEQSVNYGWSDEPLSPDVNDPFCYCTTIRKTGGQWNTRKEGSQTYGVFDKLGLWSVFTEGGLLIDLDNEMDAFGTDADGYSIVKQVKATGVKLYYGMEPQTITGLTATIIRGDDNSTLTDADLVTVAPTGTGSVNGRVAVTVKAQDLASATKKKLTCDLYVDITATCAKGTRSGRFSLKHISGSAPGVSPTLYQLLPSATEVVFSKNAAGTGYTSAQQTVKCGYTETIGESYTSHPNAVTTGVYSIYYRKTAADSYTKLTTSGVQVTPDDSFVEFILCDSTAQTVEANVTGIIDRETIPAVKDGLNGKDGEDGQSGADGRDANPNILLRTIFDKGIEFVLEAWRRNNDEQIYIDTAPDTIVSGRKSIRLNAARSMTDSNFYQSLLGKLKANTWYTLSFNAFIVDSDNRPIVSLYNLIDNTRTNIFGNGGKVILDGIEYQVSDNGHNDILISGGWNGQRHTITFLTNDNISSQTLNLQFYQAYKNSNSISTICMPKLEEGQEATPYIPHEDDLRGADGEDGKDGADAWTLTVSPSPIIINQSTSNENNFGLPVLIDFVAKCGNQAAKVGAVTATQNMGLTISPVNVGNRRLQITAINKVNDSYVTYGTIDCTVPLTCGTRSTSMSVRIEVAVNLLGTWAMTVRRNAITEAGTLVTNKINDNNTIIRKEYTGAIERSATGLTQKFTEQMSRAGADGRNLFGFNNKVHFDGAYPFIQGYGMVCTPWTRTSDKTARIYNLGMYGRLGYYTVSCQVRTSSSTAFVRLQMNWLEAVSGTTAATDGIKGVVTAYTGSWTTLTATFLFDNASGAHIGTTLQPGQEGSYDVGDINGFIDIGEIVSGTSAEKKVNNDNYIYVRHLKVEYKDIASAFCESDEDIASIGQGQQISTLELSGVGYPTTNYGRSNVYSAIISGLNNDNPWNDGRTYHDYIRQNGGINLSKGKCYTLSFWAMSTTQGFVITNYLYKSGQSIIDLTQNDIYVPSDSGTIREGVSGDGCTRIELSTSWKQYFVHFYVIRDITDATVIPLRIEKALNYNPSAGIYRQSANIYMSDIELQEGYVMSPSSFLSLIEQNARRISLVQQSGTRRAGIDIQNGTVNLFGDRVTFSNADGTVKDKVWIDPETGTIHAVDGDFKGKVTATNGSFSGNSNGFEIKLDADNRILAVNGPIGVRGLNDMTPTDGAKIVEYLRLGEMISTATHMADDGKEYYFLYPRIVLRKYHSNVQGSAYTEITINGDGISIDRITASGSKTWNFGPNASYLSNQLFITDYQHLPTSRSGTQSGGIYRDGETLKIRID